MITLRIDPVFPTDERQEILRAVAEWNHVLNGYVRFESSFAVFLADAQAADRPPVRTNAWSILPARGAAPLGRRRVVRRRSAGASRGQWRCCSRRPMVAAW